MALTLRLASPALPAATSATIFVPSDTAFLHSGPLPLSLLKYHILPTTLPLQHLTTLNPLATLLPNSPLTITSFPLSPHQHHLSIDNVTVNSTPIFHNPSLLMLSIHHFFNSSSLLLPHSVTLSLNTVSHILKSNGCSVTATFLEALLTDVTDTKFKVFAPLDETVSGAGHYSAAVFRKHVVPRLITWRDLIRLPDEALLPTLSDEFSVRVTVFPRRCLLNGVPVVVPDLYCSNLLVVHRVDGLLDGGTV